MLKQLWCRIIGTKCKWKVLHEASYTITKNMYGGRRRTIKGTMYTMQCETCGELKFKKDT